MSSLSLRNQLAVWFAAAVAVTLLLFSLGVMGVLRADEKAEAARSACAEDADPDDDLLKVLIAMAWAAPVAVLGAAGVGRLLAGRALAPLKEASARAQAARNGEGELRLPVRGRSDEWDQLAGTLNLLLEEQRGALARVKGFTADAAHELRTPLTAIIGEAETILRRERSAAELREALGTVRDEGLRMAALVEGLLLLARADARTLVAQREEVEVLALCQTAAARLLTRAARDLPGAQLVVSGDAARVRGQRALLERLLENLLDNALRHGGTRATIEVAGEADQVAVRVRDDGPGVPAAIAGAVFERFVQGDPSRAGSGSGLGLAIARAVAEAHGGTLELEPSARGSCFLLRLPRAGTTGA